MAFDFAKLKRDGAISNITDPATLFDALPNKADGYGYLRAVQKTILDSWSPRRDERDLVVKTNTGGGKTIAGLLMLQCSLHDGKGPALYVAPDPHLAARVREEAGKLGLDVVDNPESPKFLSGQSICVTFMAVLINGKSRFGLAAAAGRQPVRVGVVVIDDAHAALTQMRERTHLRIPRSHPTYDALMNLFADDLKEQGHNAFLDIQEGDRNPALRIPFWVWRDKQQQVLEILRPYRQSAAFEWAWPLLSGIIGICEAVVTADDIEIVPPCPPIEMFPSFAEADRRIYMTATLADDSVLVTHFDADPGSVSSPIVPESAADLGDRLVLSPQELNPAISHADLRAAMASLSESLNVVVLVPSYRQAGMWDDVAEVTASAADDVSAAVERLKAGHVGLVVIVNRYDGIDLPDEACRVLVIDGLPQAYSGTERREALALRDSEAMVTRQLQRLEQGMGRGVRSRDDRCAVLLVDSRLTNLVARADVALRLSPATRAQLDLSRRVAVGLEGASMDEIVAVIKQIMDGDAAFKEISREALVGVTYGPAVISPTAKPMRDAYAAAAAGRTDLAVRHAESAVAAALDAGDERLAGWLGEQLAVYLHAVDPVMAQGALAKAADRNAAVLRPIGGLAYKPVRPTAAQAQQCVDTLTAMYDSGADLLLGFERVLSQITWDPNATDETEQALADLAQHLGFSSQRPERDFRRGPDVLWAFAASKFAVIEAKSGATGDFIWKRDINQLAGSVNWCEEQYGADAEIHPVVMHRSAVVEKSGTAPEGTRVLTTPKLELLKNAVRSFATALAQDDRFRQADAAATQLAYGKLTGPGILAAYTSAAKRQE